MSNNYITVTVNNEKLKIPVPNGFKTRQRCKDCIRENKICATLNGSQICCKIEFKEDKETGEFSLFSISPCTKFGDGKINV